MKSPNRKKRIWIDLDNSPHVPFFIPIIEELEKRGYSVFLTARDAYQVVELLDLHHLTCPRIGRHYGKIRTMKILGAIYRTLQLIRAVWNQHLDLAVSHGSRSQMIAAGLLRIPSVVIFDYEHAEGLRIFHATWSMRPEVIFPKGVNERALRYPGLKEDVYIPRFTPDPAIRSRLGISNQEILVTVRPPANEAHYHNPKSDVLFHSVIEFLGQRPEVRTVLLPRNERQAVSVRNEWPEMIKSGKVIILDQVVDGLNLLWFSDLAISGGGTMNREAAALGVPVYSIFRGTIGAVDRYLSESGRLVLIEKPEDLNLKINLRPWKRPETPPKGHNATLSAIVENVVSSVERKQPATSHVTQ